MMKKLMWIFAIILLSSFAYADLTTDNQLWGTLQDANVSSFDVYGATGTTGILNGGYDFDGSSYTIKNFGSLSSPNTYSFSLWVKFDSLADGQKVIEKNKATGLSYTLETSSGNLCGRFDDSGGVNNACIATSSLSTGVWYHIVATYQNADFVKLYVDTSLTTGDATDSGIVSDSYNLFIGSGGDASDNPTSYFNGQIDEVKIFDKALNSTEIAELYNSDSPIENDVASANQVFYANFDSLYDWSENGNDLTGFNGVTYDATENAFYFGGTNQYVDTNYNFDLTDGDDFAFSMWIKGNMEQTSTDLLGDYDRGGDIDGISININSDDKISISNRATSGGSNGDVFLSNTVLLDNTEYYIAGNVNGNGTMQLWINGLPDGSQQSFNLGSSQFSGLNFLLGTIPTGANNYYNGFISGVAIYNRTLSSSEVSELYIQGRTYNPYEVSNFTITALDSFDSSTITTFNATINGIFYDTTTGIIITPYLLNETNVLNITVESAGFTDYTNQSYNTDNGNLQVSLSAGTITFNATELITNSPVSGNITFNSQTKETGESFTRPSEGIYNVTFSSSGYNSKTEEINFSTFTSPVYTIENITNATITFTANNSINGSTINDFTITYVFLELGLSGSASTSNGTLILPLLKDYEYNFSINASNYAIQNVLLTLNATNSYNFELFTENSLNVNVYDEITRNLLSGTNITLEVIGASTETLISTTGAFYVDFLTPSSYELRYYSTNSDDYRIRSSYVSVSDQSTQDINLYLLNETVDKKAQITFTVIDETLSSVEDAEVIISRYYNSLGSYVDVASRTSDASGNAVFELEIVDAFYQYRVEFGGEIKFISSNNGIQFTESDNIDVFIDTGVSLVNEFQTIDDITFTPVNFSQTSNNTGTFYFSFSSEESVTVCLEYTQSSFNGDSQQQTCVTNTGGTLFLPIEVNANYKSTINAVAKVKVSDDIGFTQLDGLTVLLGGIQSPVIYDDWASNLAWVSVLITMVSALIFISISPSIALLFQAFTFLAMIISPVQIIPIPVGVGVVILSIFLLIINGIRGER